MGDTVYICGHHDPGHALPSHLDRADYVKEVCDTDDCIWNGKHYYLRSDMQIRPGDAYVCNEVETLERLWEKAKDKLRKSIIKLDAQKYDLNARDLSVMSDQALASYLLMAFNSQERVDWFGVAFKDLIQSQLLIVDMKAMAQHGTHRGWWIYSHGKSVQKIKNVCEQIAVVDNVVKARSCGHFELRTYEKDLGKHELAVLQRRGGLGSYILNQPVSETSIAVAWALVTPLQPLQPTDISEAMSPLSLGSPLLTPESSAILEATPTPPNSPSEESAPMLTPPESPRDWDSVHSAGSPRNMTRPLAGPSITPSPPSKHQQRMQRVRASIGMQFPPTANQETLNDRIHFFRKQMVPYLELDFEHGRDPFTQLNVEYPPHPILNPAMAGVDINADYFSADPEMADPGLIFG